MSRIGKLPVELVEGLEIEVTHNGLTMNGPRGSLYLKVPVGISIKKDGNMVFVGRDAKKEESLALQGTIRAHLINMIKGLTQGWSKTLELVGAGYRAELNGEDLVLNIGFSHPVVVKKPEGISFKIDKNFVTIEGSSRELVGNWASKIRDFKPPDPYKAMGIKYQDEIVRKKPGKQAAKTEGGAK